MATDMHNLFDFVMARKDVVLRLPRVDQTCSACTALANYALHWMTAEG